MAANDEKLPPLHEGGTPQQVFAVEMSLEDRVSEFHAPAQIVFSYRYPNEILVGFVLRCGLITKVAKFLNLLGATTKP
jgi:hypothetical protein